MENIENKPIKKRQAHPDRIVLETKSMEFVKSVEEQIKETFGGMIELTNKEIANFLLQTRTMPLTSGELKAVKEKYFDDVRAAQWAVQQLKAAKNAGKEVSLAEVLSKLQMPNVKEKRVSKEPKEKARKQVGDGAGATEKNVSNAAVGAIKADLKQAQGQVKYS